MENCILHGTWLKQEPERFLLWGEERTPRKPKGRQPKIPNHPYAVSSEILENMLQELSESLLLDDFDPQILKGEAVLRLPMVGKIPLPSHQAAIDLEGDISISECRANTLYLEAIDSIKILSSIPVHVYDLPYEIGSDIRFWSISAKFLLYMISHHKFVPMLYEDGGEFTAVWEPVLDDPYDVEKLDRLVRSMPDACRSVRSIFLDTSPPVRAGGNKKAETQYDLPESHPKELVLDFIKVGVDRWVRSQAENVLSLKDIKKLSDPTITGWFNGLVSQSGKFQAPKLMHVMKELCKALASWRNAGIVPGAKTEKFRPCFRLEPPESERTAWILRYFLQAMDDLSLLVPADLVWKERRAKLKYLNRELVSPQEQMLTGLGVASRMFPPIERSLRQARPEACALELSEAYQFLNESSLILQQSGFGVLAPPWWTEKRSQLKARVSVSSPKTEGTGILSLDSILSYNWQIALGDEVITPEELEQLAKLKIPLVQMRGQWVLLRPEDIKSAMEFLQKHGESGEMSLRDTVKLSLDETPQLEGIRVEAIETPVWLGSFINELRGGIKPVDQPKDFVGQLRPYQLIGLSWLAFMKKWGLGACLADDMGLGKTPQTIALLLREKKPGKGKSVPNLLICPTSVVGNWQREITKFAPKLKAMIHHGGDRLSGEEFTKSIIKYDLVITSYGLARRDADDLSGVSWKGVILDEAQNIKNPSSKIAQVVRVLRSEYRFALTGTPVENRLMELWSIMEFLNPGYLGSQNRFNQSYVLPIERYGDEDATRGLRSVVAPFIMRRLKTDPKIISDLPEKMEMKVYCSLTREQVTLYEAVVKDMMQQLEDDTGEGEIKRRGMILSGLMKLKQLCNHPAIFLHDSSEIEGRSGKVQRLMEMLEEVIAEGDKALIFTQFTEMGGALQRYVSSKLKCDILYLHGGVAQKNRDRMVSLFQSSSDGPPIFVISIRAGGTGLNLTRANHVFHFDRWWNPAVEDQATDRAFRIGQTRNVQVYKFVCSGTLEEQIDQIIEKKKSLAQNVIGTGEDWITELSNDELQKMITLRRDDALSADER